jgi:hypothetical protein
MYGYKTGSPNANAYPSTEANGNEVGHAPESVVAPEPLINTGESNIYA